MSLRRGICSEESMQSGQSCRRGDSRGGAKRRVPRALKTPQRVALVCGVPCAKARPGTSGTATGTFSMGKAKAKDSKRGKEKVFREEEPSEEESEEEEVQTRGRGAGTAWTVDEWARLTCEEEPPNAQSHARRRMGGREAAAADRGRGEARALCQGWGRCESQAKRAEGGGERARFAYRRLMEEALQPSGCVLVNSSPVQSPVTRVRKPVDQLPLRPVTASPFPEVVKATATQNLLRSSQSQRRTASTCHST